MMEGRDKWKRRMDRLTGREVIETAGKVVFEGADMISAHAFREISRVSVYGDGHVPSKPGEFPNRDTGVLQGGLETQRTGPVTAEVRSTALYAAPLEFGTSRMAARPYMRPSRDAKRKEIERLFATEIDKLVKRS